MFGSLYFERYWAICVLQLFVNQVVTSLIWKLTLSFQSSRFFYIQNKSRQKFKYHNFSLIRPLYMGSPIMHPLICKPIGIPNMSPLYVRSLPPNIGPSSLSSLQNIKFAKGITFHQVFSCILLVLFIYLWSWTGYLEQERDPVKLDRAGIVWYRLLPIFWLLLPEFNFWRGDWALDYVSSQIWDFPNISS